MEVISISEAARQLRCSRATLYRAIDRGEINALDTGSAKVIVVDEAWSAYAPQDTGRRAARAKQQDEEDAS